MFYSVVANKFPFNEQYGDYICTYLPICNYYTFIINGVCEESDCVRHLIESYRLE